MADLREAALAELRALEQSLELDPRYQKIKAIKSLLAVYDSQLTSSATAIAATNTATAESVSRTAALITSATFARPVGCGNAQSEHTKNATDAISRRRTSPDRERALKAAVDYISGRHFPTKTAEILEHLSDLGIPVAGTVPLSNLSAMLHHSSLFQTHGRRGWTLAADQQGDRNAPDGIGESEQIALPQDHPTEDIEEAF